MWTGGCGAQPVPAQVWRPLRAAVQWPLGRWLSRERARKGSESMGSCFTVMLPVDFALFSALYLSYQNEVKQNRKRAKTFISEILLTAEKNTNLLKGFCPIFPIKQKGDVPAVLLQASLQHVRFAGHHTVINAEPLSRSGKLTAAESPEPGAYGSVPQAEVLL